jgi:hypothetical protein
VKEEWIVVVIRNGWSNLHDSSTVMTMKLYKGVPLEMNNSTFCAHCQLIVVSNSNLFEMRNAFHQFHLGSQVTETAAEFTVNGRRYFSAPAYGRRVWSWSRKVDHG